VQGLKVPLPEVEHGVPPPSAPSGQALLNQVVKAAQHPLAGLAFTT